VTATNIAALPRLSAATLMQRPKYRLSATTKALAGSLLFVRFCITEIPLHRIPCYANMKNLLNFAAFRTPLCDYENVPFFWRQICVLDTTRG
jgi:hypothetical protein